MEQTMRHEGRRYRLQIVDQSRDGAAATDKAAGAVFDLFARRAEAFGFGEGVVVAYPDIGPGSAFLADPAADVAARLAALAREGREIGPVVILTTFGPALARALTPLGFRAEGLGLVAAPNGALALRRDAAGGATLYIEAVDDAAPEIHPALALGLFDEAGALAAGVSVALTQACGVRAAWIVANATREGEPPGLGTLLSRCLDETLRTRGVSQIDLGTQTAPRFYERVGYRVTRRVVEGLRTRKGSDGRPIPCDLAMMTKSLGAGR